MRQLPFLLLRLLGQYMTLEGVLSLYFTGAGEGEPLLCTGIGLHLWHFPFCFYDTV